MLCCVWAWAWKWAWEPGRIVACRRGRIECGMGVNISVAVMMRVMLGNYLLEVLYKTHKTFFFSSVYRNPST